MSEVVCENTSDEFADQGLVERILDITIRLVKATTTPKDWIASVFDVKHYRGDADERDCRRAEFEKVDLKNYDEVGPSLSLDNSILTSKRFSRK